MRQTTINGISIRYADAVGFAFLPCIFEARGNDLASMDIEISIKGYVYNFSSEAFKTRCIADYREYIQDAFDGIGFGFESDEYELDYEISSLMEKANIEVTFSNASGDRLGAFIFSTSYVWGAMRPGEVWNGHKRLKWFTHFPFSFGLYANADTKILVSPNGAPQKYIDIPREGMYDFFNTHLDPRAKRTIIYNYDGEIKQATFDNTFDLTFYLEGGKQSELLCIEHDDTEDGIYLRWIDRHGFYRYWLFTQGENERAISSDTSFIRNNLAAYQDTYAYVGAYGRRQGYQREDTITLCAPLLDSDTYDLLQDVASSPVVDMYMSDGSWQGVTIKAGSYTKSTAILQDFVCNLVLNNTNIQQL